MASFWVSMFDFTGVSFMKWQVKADCQHAVGLRFFASRNTSLFVEEYLVQQKSWLVTLKKGIERVVFFGFGCLA